MYYKLRRKRAAKSEPSPGSPADTGEKKVEKVRVTLMDYDAKGNFEEREITDLTELAAAKDSDSVTWVNVAGLHEINVIESIGQFFGIHPLLLEDILTTDQQPKMEQYDNYIYIILKMLCWQPEEHTVETEQISIVLGSHFVLTFQERDPDDFEALRQRLRDPNKRIRKLGPDFLAYSVLDAIVDGYFVVLEAIGDEIELRETEVVRDPGSEILQSVHDLKRELLLLRKSIWPFREVIGGLQRGESELFQKDTLIYLRDVYEHTVQIIDTVETFRDIVSSMLDIYLSSVSNRLNEVMRVLTVISTIFIPLTFITSLYGMNFHYMPELSWRWGYFVLWANHADHRGRHAGLFQEKGLAVSAITTPRAAGDNALFRHSPHIR